MYVLLQQKTQYLPIKPDLSRADFFCDAAITLAAQYACQINLKQLQMTTAHEHFDPDISRDRFPAIGNIMQHIKHCIKIPQCKNRNATLCDASAITDGIFCSTHQLTCDNYIPFTPTSAETFAHAFSLTILLSQNFIFFYDSYRQMISMCSHTPWRN